MSFFVFLVWVLLLCHVLPINRELPMSPFYISLVVLTLCSMIVIVVLGSSGRGRPHTRFTIQGEEPPPALQVIWESTVASTIIEDAATKGNYDAERQGRDQETGNRLQGKV